MQEYFISGCTVLPVSKKTELGSSDQEASSSAGKGKSTGLVLVPCHTWKFVPLAISHVVVISEDPGYHLL